MQAQEPHRLGWAVCHDCCFPNGNHFSDIGCCYPCIANNSATCAKTHDKIRKQLSCHLLNHSGFVTGILSAKRSMGGQEGGGAQGMMNQTRASYFAQTPSSAIMSSASPALARKYAPCRVIFGPPGQITQEDEYTKLMKLVEERNGSVKMSPSLPSGSPVPEVCGGCGLGKSLVPLRVAYSNPKVDLRVLQ
eukprot:135860-Pyramimonas_sp.AAC.1